MRTKSICVWGPVLDMQDSLLEEGLAGSYDLAFIDADKANYDVLRAALQDLAGKAAKLKPPNLSQL